MKVYESSTKTGKSPWAIYALSTSCRRRSIRNYARWEYFGHAAVYFDEKRGLLSSTPGQCAIYILLPYTRKKYNKKNIIVIETCITRSLWIASARVDVKKTYEQKKKYACSRYERLVVWYPPTCYFLRTERMYPFAYGICPRRKILRANIWRNSVSMRQMVYFPCKVGKIRRSLIREKIDTYLRRKKTFSCDFLMPQWLRMVYPKQSRIYPKSRARKRTRIKLLAFLYKR